MTAEGPVLAGLFLEYSLGVFYDTDYERRPAESHFEELGLSRRTGEQLNDASCPEGGPLELVRTSLWEPAA